MKRANRLLSCFAALLALALLCVPGASATGCRAVTYKSAAVSYSTYAAPAYVEKVVTPIIAAYVPVIAPTYAGVYVPAAYAYPAAPGAAPQPQQSPGGDDLTNAVRALTGEVRGLADRVNRIEGGAPPPAQGPRREQAPPPPEGNGGGTAVLLKHCAACHESAVSKARGGGLTLFSGGRLAELTGEQVGVCIDEVSKGHMPLRTQISDRERLDIINALLRK